ncbi:MAG: hypothetical protein SFT91_05980 [Rickettsiaceae bacterium]|nr:hypothetical protein [Rickettsiaceae bacterium]
MSFIKILGILSPTELCASLTEARIQRRKELFLNITSQSLGAPDIFDFPEEQNCDKKTEFSTSEIMDDNLHIIGEGFEGGNGV